MFGMVFLLCFSIMFSSCAKKKEYKKLTVREFEKCCEAMDLVEFIDRKRDDGELKDSLLKKQCEEEHSYGLFGFVGNYDYMDCEVSYIRYQDEVTAAENFYKVYDYMGELDSSSSWVYTLTNCEKTKEEGDKFVCTAFDDGEKIYLIFVRAEDTIVYGCIRPATKDNVNRLKEIMSYMDY